jgi:hypothetical protein
MARLDALREMTEASSASEVIRNAIRLYEALVQKEVRDGATVLIKERDGSVTPIRIF